MHGSFFFNNQRYTFSDFIAPGLTLTSKDSIYSVTRQVEGYTDCFAVLLLCGCGRWVRRFWLDYPNAFHRKNTCESCFQKMPLGFAWGVLSVAHFSPLCLNTVAS